MVGENPRILYPSPCIRDHIVAKYVIVDTFPSMSLVLSPSVLVSNQVAIASVCVRSQSMRSKGGEQRVISLHCMVKLHTSRTGFEQGLGTAAMVRAVSVNFVQLSIRV